MWEFLFYAIFFWKKDQPKKVGFALSLYLILAKRQSTFFGTIFTITIKFVQLMIDFFLRFDPLPRGAANILISKQTLDDANYQNRRPRHCQIQF